MFSTEEKVIILGSLLHDIGKFQQRCTGNPRKLYHDLLGRELILSGRFQHRFENIVGKENLNALVSVIYDHHSKKSDNLTQFVQIADHLSASERVVAEKNEENRINWKHNHLASLFSKINLLSKVKLEPKYYKHAVLTSKNYDIIIPKNLTVEEIAAKDYAYAPKHFEDFQSELEAVLDFYKQESDFYSLINLLLILLEKWLWCIPDFTGSSETDISLYNHLKDVAALSHALYLSRKDNPQSSSLNLVIGDIPGIQNYIFNVVNKKPAKVLRGRSIFVQILTRNFATIFLNECGLTEANLIMLAGGKFYLIAPDTEKFISDFNRVMKKIDKYLFDEFRMELSFNSIYYKFDYAALKNKKTSFGQIIEEASFKLLENRHMLFKNRLFEDGAIVNNNYIWNEKYFGGDDSGSYSIKCGITDKPIRHGRATSIKDGDIKLTVDKQVINEFEIGSKITGSNLLVVLGQDNLTIDPENIYRINKKMKVKHGPKILINPDLDSLLNEKVDSELFNNACFLEVANYCSMTPDEKGVLPFKDMVKENEGAQYLSLIKGDIDNLGLIMAYGLTDDIDDLTAISRTTTLSNHLKYYFSFFLNGFLEDWEKKNKSNKVYTIFAGGDDLMLIAPQSNTVELISTFNKSFQDFVCANDEVHISYSVTHFKDHSPIRIIANFAGEAQARGKGHTRKSQSELLMNGNVNSFNSEFDKARTLIFDTPIQNSDLDLFIKYSESLTKLTVNGLSKGLIRKLLELANMIKKYDETKDPNYLIGYARVTHAVNRMKITNSDLSHFIKSVLVINTNDNKEADKLKKLLLPLICQVIYNIRN